MTQAILTLNSGSSSIKFSIHTASEGVSPEPYLLGDVSGVGGHPVLRISREGNTLCEKEISKTLDHAGTLALVLEQVCDHLGPHDLEAVGHRIVHGGLDFRKATLIDADVFNRLQRLTPLAPGHQPHNLEGVRIAQERWHGTPQIACFDTAFHRDQPQLAQLYALPRSMAEEGIIRYGFHGLSYAYIASRLCDVLDEERASRVIVAHLGSGASMCAMRDGKSVATTMGFTALDGLPMSTRCGDIDPGVLLYLLQENGMSPDEVSDLLHRKSGLAGLSGISGDIRALEASADPAARRAIDYFVYRCARQAGSLVSALGGLDAFIFTGGIGENSCFVRAQIIKALSWVGLKLDDTANSTGKTCITLSGVRPAGFRIATNEELVIAQQSHAILSKH